MSKLYFQRNQRRRGLYLPLDWTRANPSLIFPLYGIEGDSTELEDLVRAILAKGGVTDEKVVQAVCQDAELQHEARIKVWEARQEVRRLMALKSAGAKLMQVGFRRWKTAFFRPVMPKFKEGLT